MSAPNYSSAIDDSLKQESTGNEANSDTLIYQLIILNAQFQTSIGLRKHNVFCIDRDGGEITFVEFTKIYPLLKILLGKFVVQFEMSTDPVAIAQALAFFWYGFVAIHPFADGNGRTGKAFIRRQLAKQNLEISSFELLDRFLIRGDRLNELKKLEAIFLVSMCFKEQKGELNEKTTK